MAYVVIKSVTKTDKMGIEHIEKIPQGYYHHLPDANEFFQSLAEFSSSDIHEFHIEECF